MHVIKTVFKKEFIDILRDTRALLTVALIAILSGPVILLIISNMVASFETHAERRILVAYGMENAPSLENHLRIQTVQIQRAPENYELALVNGNLIDPVVVIPNDFEKKWQAGEHQTLEIITNSANGRVNASVGRVKRWLSRFARERALVQMAMRGVAPAASEFVSIEKIDLANAAAYSSRIFNMLPYFLVLAALYGVWGSAIDTTVGEKDRRTLEPLLVIPHPTWKMFVGKWLGVSSVGSLVAAIAVLSFLPAQWLMESETLKAMFHFGWFEALVCLVLILPLSGLFAALLMLVGVMAQTMRQAQANASLVLLVITFLPMLFLTTEVAQGAKRWLPILAHHHHVTSLFNTDITDFSGIITTVLATFALACLSLLIAIKRVRSYSPV